MKIISSGVYKLHRGSGSDVLVIKKDYCRILGIGGEKKSKVRETLVRIVCHFYYLFY